MIATRQIAEVDLPASAREILARRDELAGVARRYGIDRLILVGSRARGEADADSDTDFIYHYPPGVTLGWELFDLEEEWSSILGCRVESMHERGVKEHWKRRVEDDGILVFDDSAA